MGIKHDYKKSDYHHVLTKNNQPLPVVMSINSFKKSIQSLATVTDFVDFINYAKHYITQTESPLAFNYLQDYITSATVFKRAREIDTLLVSQKYKATTAQFLAVTNEKQHLNQFSSVKKSIGFWDGFIKSMMHPNRTKEQEPSPSYYNMLNALMSESIFSRYLLISCIHDFMNAPKQRLQEGYVVHMRSFSLIDRHYVFYFYSNEINSPHHKSKASLQLQQVANHVNQKNQNPPLAEIIVIGLEMVNTGFDVDMCYMQGRNLQKTDNNHYSS